MDKDDKVYSRVKCENCGYIFVAPYPEDSICRKCKKFSANLFEFINGKGNYLKKIEPKEFEITPSKDIIGTKKKKNSKIPKKIIFYGIVSKERIQIYYSDKNYEYILELISNLDFIATSTLSGTLDKMLIIFESEEDLEKENLIARFFEKNGIIHILIGNLSDKDSDWVFNQVSMFLNDLLQKNNINPKKELSIGEKSEISIKMNKFLNYIEKEIELKVKFQNPNFNYIDNWLRVDYFGLSSESVGVISLLLDKENNLKFDEQKHTEPESEISISEDEKEKKEEEIIEFKESVLTAKIEAILAIILGNMKGYPRWISIKSSFQKYRYLSFQKLENQFFSYYITEGNIEKLNSLELFFNIHLKDAVSKKFTGSLKVFNELKKRIRKALKAILDRIFH